MGYSVRNIVIAAVAALAAVIAVFMYTNSVKQQATGDQALRQVLVATQEIPVGTPAEEAIGRLEVHEVRDSDFVPGAIDNVDAVAGKRVTQTIFVGQQVVDRMFEEQAKVQTPSLQLDANERGIRVKVTQGSGALGAVKPGDRVDVFVTVITKDPETSNDYVLTRRILTGAEVLEAPVEEAAAKDGGGGLSGKNGDTGAEAWIMLKVSQRDAGRMSWTQYDEGTTKLWFAVRPPDSQATDGGSRIESVSSILADEKSPASVLEEVKRAIAGTDARGAAAPVTTPTQSSTSNDQSQSTGSDSKTKTSTKKKSKG